MQLKQKKQQLEMVINNLQYEQMDLKSEVEQLQLQLAQQYLHYRDQVLVKWLDYPSPLSKPTALWTVWHVFVPG